MTGLLHARSLLFVPADRPERFAKARASGADLVCIDLEDAVAPPARAQARQALVAQLDADAAGCGLRINAVTTTDGLRDLLALAKCKLAPAFVMLAKADDPEQLRVVAAALPEVPLIALLESPRALAAAAPIAQAAPNVQALMLGGADLCATLGARFAWEPLLYARGAIAAAAAGAGIAAIDVPFVDLADEAGLHAETARVAALGFSAKACIHPKQLAGVHAALAPQPDELARARRVVQAVADAGPGGAALQVDGRFVDRPVLLAAQRLIQRAGG